MVDGSRDWLNEKLFSEDDRREMEQIAPASDDGLSKMEYRTGDEAATAVNGNQSGSAHFGNDFDSDSESDEDESEDDFLNGSDGFGDVPQAGSDREELVRAMAEVTNDPALAEDLIPQDLDLSGMAGMAGNNQEDEGEDDEDFEFDEEEFNKLMEDKNRGMDETKGGETAEEIANIPGIASNDYVAFRTHMENELVAEGRSAQEVDDQEARQLFEIMRGYFEERSVGGIPGANILDDDSDMTEDSMLAEESFDKAWNEDSAESSFASSLSQDKSQVEGSGVVERSYGTTFDNGAPLQEGSGDRGPSPQRQRSPTSSMDSMPGNQTIYADDYIEWTNSQAQAVSSIAFESSSNDIAPAETTEYDMKETQSAPLPRQYNVSPLEEEGEDQHILELQEILPGLPLSRIEKVSEEFERAL